VQGHADPGLFSGEGAPIQRGGSLPHAQTRNIESIFEKYMRIQGLQGDVRPLQSSSRSASSVMIVKTVHNVIALIKMIQENIIPHFL